MKRAWGWLLLVVMSLLASSVVYLRVAAPIPEPAATLAGAAVEPAAVAVDVGVAPVGRTSFEFTARIDQRGGVFDIYGYVTYLHDQPPDLLFTDPISHTEATARITMSGTTNLTARSILSNVFNVDSVGSVTFYFDEDDGASFDNLESFSRGTAIGTATLRLQNILTVTGANTGIANGNGELIHATATPFEFNGVEYRLGRPGMLERVTFAGGGVRFEPEPPVAIIAVGGSGTVAGFNVAVPLVKK